MMNVKIYLPTEIFFEQENISKIIAEGLEGYFTLLPRHIDYISVLVPGIMIIENQSGGIGYVAVDEGTLVKRHDQVSISTRNAVRGESMQALSRIVDEQFMQTDDMEKKARAMLTSLEYNMLRRFSELKH